jgi:hypothetical protein
MGVLTMNGQMVGSENNPGGYTKQPQPAPTQEDSVRRALREYYAKK